MKTSGLWTVSHPSHLAHQDDPLGGLARLRLLAVGVLLAIVLAAPLISGCGAGASDAGKICVSGKCLTYQTWGANIDATINGKAVGYAYEIRRNGMLRAAGQFGHARTVADPPATDMTWYAPANSASVTKTLTAVALLRLLNTKHISVASPIHPYLPPSWQLGQGVDSITFAELLTHTSGIRDTQNPDTSYTALKTTMAQNIAPANKVYKYQNANFALSRIIIPYLLGSANPIALPPPSFPPQFIDFEIDLATAQDYLSYMSSVYGGDFPISCTPNASSPTLSYLYPAAGSGKDWGDWLHLCGAGGLQMSVDNMAAFLGKLTSGAYLPVNPSSNPATITLPLMVEKMYGWDYRFPNTTYGACVAKNGDLGYFDSNNKYVPYLTTLVVYCPKSGLEFAGLSNSRLGTATTNAFGFVGSWDDIVIQAYNMSWQ